jgi:hypothetical protein
MWAVLSGCATSPFFAYSRGGVNQMGEDQARFWIVAGTNGDSGRLFRAES